MRQATGMSAMTPALLVSWRRPAPSRHASRDGQLLVLETDRVAAAGGRRCDQRPLPGGRCGRRAGLGRSVRPERRSEHLRRCFRRRQPGVVPDHRARRCGGRRSLLGRHLRAHRRPDTAFERLAEQRGRTRRRPFGRRLGGRHTRVRHDRGRRHAGRHGQRSGHLRGHVRRRDAGLHGAGRRAGRAGRQLHAHVAGRHKGVLPDHRGAGARPRGRAVRARGRRDDVARERSASTAS